MEYVWLLQASDKPIVLCPFEKREQATCVSRLGECIAKAISKLAGQEWQRKDGQIGHNVNMLA